MVINLEEYKRKKEEKRIEENTPIMERLLPLYVSEAEHMNILETILKDFQVEDFDYFFTMLRLAAVVPGANCVKVSKLKNGEIITTPVFRIEEGPSETIEKKEDIPEGVVDKFVDDITAAFNQLQETKESFYRDHDKRMQELNEAINSINNNNDNGVSHEEIDATLDEIGKQLDDLLDD